MTMNKKYSRYNTLLRVNDRFGLFYNAMSDRFIVLKMPAYEALQRNRAADLEHCTPTLYGQLVEAGGIVDADVDEVQLVRDMIHRIRGVRLSWQPIDLVRCAMPIKLYIWMAA